jgi:hypothetical protein
MLCPYNVELSIYTVVPHYVSILTATVHYGCSSVSSDSKTVQNQGQLKIKVEQWWSTI